MTFSLRWSNQEKTSPQGFSKNYLKWVTSYLTGRRQFVRINDAVFSTTDVCFGVPQGSILGPVLFNLYVNDLSDNLDLTISSHQYADDTFLYSHCKPADINSSINNIQSNLDDLSTWSTFNNLVLNPKKTKVMLFSTTQLSRVHHLEEHSIHFLANGVELKQTNNTLLLGIVTRQNLKWKDEVNRKISGFSAILSVLRKRKYLAPYNIWKQLEESLVLSKSDYNDVVCNPVPDYLLKRLQRMQLAVAGSVLRYCIISVYTTVEMKKSRQFG